jgi:protein phosphatase methylesterase 1
MLTAISSATQARQGLSELPWTDFFGQELLLHQDTDSLLITHHAYLTPPTAEKAPLFVTHHGAGSSGLSFAALAVEIHKLLPDAGVLSLDARGHGKTGISSSNQDDNATDQKSDYVDLTLSTLSRDLEFVVNATQEQMKWEKLPDIILVGHSLGGAVVTELAKNGQLGSKILGYAVLDVVEGIVLLPLYFGTIALIISC